MVKTKDQFDVAYEKVSTLNLKLVSLVERWENEKDYEDWKDYHSQIGKMLLPLGMMITASKPFQFNFHSCGKVYVYKAKVNAKSISFTFEEA